jgi:hypothetical protein
MSGKLGDDDSQNKYELAALVLDRFSRGLALDETIADLTIDGMKLGFEAPQPWIERFYETCLSRQTDPQALARLAGMSELNYERSRKSEAQRMGMRISVLDREVTNLKAASASAANESITPPPPQPWPEPVAGEALLDELVATLTRFLILPAHAADAIAL